MGDTLKQYWNNRDAETFDSVSRRSGRMVAITRVAEMAKSYIYQSGSKSIDLGCGTGLFAEVVGATNIIGVDCSNSFLVLARKRMDTVWQRDILNLGLEDNSVDNIVSLFVIDDYVTEMKLLLFTQVFSYLKPGGHFFFSAYSPNDERMGKLRSNKPFVFKVYLESASFYKNTLQYCGYVCDTVEIITTDGIFDTESEVLKLKREFIVITAHKPLNIEEKNCEQLDAPDFHSAALHGNR